MDSISLHGPGGAVDAAREASGATPSMFVNGIHDWGMLGYNKCDKFWLVENECSPGFTYFLEYFLLVDKVTTSQSVRGRYLPATLSPLSWGKAVDSCWGMGLMGLMPGVHFWERSGHQLFGKKWPATSYPPPGGGV